MVFLDECGFSLNLYRLYGWAQSYERCREDVPFVRGVNRSVLGTLSLSGMTALFHKLGAIKRVDFEAFLKDKLLPRLPQGSVLVLDNARNARTHHSGEVAKIVEGVGCSSLYLPPYSPDFSPIELAWSWIKDRVRREKPRDDEQRQKAIEKAATDLPPAYAELWFRKCGYSQS